MEIRVILMLFSVLLISVLLGAQCVITAVANPIPLPVLIMPEEYIDVSVSLVNGSLFAKVDGVYPFHNAGYEEVVMDYPVPPDAANISVRMNETSLDWAYNEKLYPTALGDWPMINWTISPIPRYFIMRTHYEHLIPIVDGNYALLYAMGTGKYLDTYAKQTTAYVNVRMYVNFTNLQVYTVWFWNGSSLWYPANYGVTKENTTEIVTLTVKSSLFHPLVEDFLMTFTLGQHATWDVNADGKTDMKDLATEAKAFGAYPGHPRWNPMLDITGSIYLVPDLKIDIRDISLVARHYGETGY